MSICVVNKSIKVPFRLEKNRNIVDNSTMRSKFDSGANYSTIQRKRRLLFSYLTKYDIYRQNMSYAHHSREFIWLDTNDSSSG